MLQHETWVGIGTARVPKVPWGRGPKQTVLNLAWPYPLCWSFTLLCDWEPFSWEGTGSPVAHSSPSGHPAFLTGPLDGCSY